MRRGTWCRRRNYQFLEVTENDGDPFIKMKKIHMENIGLLFAAISAGWLRQKRKQPRKPPPRPPRTKWKADTISFPPPTRRNWRRSPSGSHCRSRASSPVSHATGRLYWNDEKTVRIFTPVSGRVSAVLADIGTIMTQRPMRRWQRN